MNPGGGGGGLETNLNNMESNPIGNSNGTMTTTDTMPQSSGNRLISKKTLAQGMFDVALLSSNTNQLVHLINDSNVTGRRGLRTTAIVLLILSILLQIVVGGLLIALVTRGRNPRDPNDPQRRPVSRRLNNVATILIFFITIINVIIPSLHPTHEDRALESRSTENQSPNSLNKYDNRSWKNHGE